MEETHPEKRAAVSLTFPDGAQKRTAVVDVTNPPSTLPQLGVGGGEGHLKNKYLLEKNLNKMHIMKEIYIKQKKGKSLKQISLSHSQENP